MLASCDTVEEEEIVIVPYRGPVITQEEADRNGVWSATYLPDTRTVILEQTRPTGETRRRLALQDSSTSLPLFVSYWGGPEGYSLRSGTIQIAEWNVEGVVSGSVDGTLGRGAWSNAGRTHFEFRYDFSQD